MCMCIFLQAYRFLAINKKLGLSGRPERPVGCIGTCKVYVTAKTPTDIYIYVAAFPVALLHRSCIHEFLYVGLHKFQKTLRS